MKNKTAPEDSKQKDGPIDGPGSQLRKARERQGLDQATVAAQLHLSQALIHALEWDDYEKLPSAVFVQGYLRNYSRLLGVDEEVVIRAYQDLNPSPDQVPLPRNQPDEVAKELHGDHRMVRFVTWTVVVLLGVLVFFWWQGRMSLPEHEPISSVEEGEAVPPVFPPSEREVPEQPETAPAAQAPVEAILPPAGEEAAREPPQAEPTSEPDAAGALSQEAPPPIEERPSTVEAPPEETTQPPVAEPAPVVETSPAPVAEGMVVFQFSGPCWVEVRDATGRARIIGMMHDGIRRSLDAALGPFEVVIGDIEVVSVSVNGSAVNLRTHARGKVARFTLDPSNL